MLPRLLINRAIRSVIRIFRESGAVSVDNASSIDELGLNPKPMIKRLLGTRDYKPHALRVLMNADIVKVDEDGNLYLSEEQLLKSRWST